MKHVAGGSGDAVPVVYANDNFGRWRSDLDDVGERVRRRNAAARARTHPAAAW